MGNPTLLVVLVVIIAFFIFWQWRGNRRRREQEEQKSAQLVKGAEVMTNSGIFGTVESVDLENNKVVLETSPGHFLTVHRQAIARIETPAEESADAIGSTDAATSTATLSSAIDQANAQAQAEAAKTAEQPEFGERITPTKNDD